MPYITQDKGVKDSSSEKGSTRIKVETSRASQVHEDDEVVHNISDHEEDNVDDLIDYFLARNRIRRNITPPSRIGNAEMIYYALSVAKSIEYQEHLTIEKQSLVVIVSSGLLP